MTRKKRKCAVCGKDLSHNSRLGKPKSYAQLASNSKAINCVNSITQRCADKALTVKPSTLQG